MYTALGARPFRVRISMEGTLNVEFFTLKGQ
jgi:hypothetical protein